MLQVFLEKLHCFKLPDFSWEAVPNRWTSYGDRPFSRFVSQPQSTMYSLLEQSVVVVSSKSHGFWGTSCDVFGEESGAFP